MYKKTIILATAAVLTVAVMTSMMPLGQVFAQTNSQNGGIGGAGGAGGVGGNGGVNINSQSGALFQIGGQHNHQSANGGDANGGDGGSANGGNNCFSVVGSNHCRS